jgi:nucleoside phosphorylase
LDDTAAGQLDFSDVTIGILTALEEEYAACREIFDPDRRGVEKQRRSTSGILTCWLCPVPTNHGGRHIVAVVQLVNMGTTAAAIGANILLQHCDSLKYLLMCGIAGAVPDPNKGELHVRLGDIVVSDKLGIVQYDFGKQRDPRLVTSATRGSSAGSRFHRALAKMASWCGVCLTGKAHDEVVDDPFAGFEVRLRSRPPCPELLGAVNRLHANEMLLGRNEPREWEKLIDDFLRRSKNSAAWKRPGNRKDRLIDTPDGQGAAIPHPRNNNRRGQRPHIFRGPIGVANVVLADPCRRNALRDKFGIRAVEMEGSGVADAAWVARIGYLIVRGTCDYCNSCKNNDWHKYAALIAAAYARTVVEYLHPIDSRDSGSTQAIPKVPDLPSSRPSSGPVTTGTSTVSGASRPAVWQPFDQAEVSAPLRSSPTLPVAMNPDSARSWTAPIPLDPINQLIPAYPVSGLDERNLKNLMDQIKDLLKEANWQKAEPLAAELEKQLRLLPRRGEAIRDGWIQLAQIESRRLFANKQAGRAIDTARLQSLRQEAESVVD